MQKKTLLPQSVHKLKRIWILCLISLCIAPLNAQTLYKIEMPNYILQASGTNTETLYIKNKESENLIQLGKLKFGWTPAITMENTCSYEIIEVNGYQAIRATYTFPSSVPSSITLTGTFIARPDRVDVQYWVSGVPTGYVTNWGGSQFRFILSNKANTQILPEAKLGLWQRDAQGGLPIEAADSNFFPFLIKDKIICLAYGPENKANSSWKDDWYRHTVLIDNKDGSYSTKFSVLVASSDWPYEAICAQWKGRPFALTLSTDKPYNWWENASGTLSVKANLANTSQEKKNCTLKYWIRDYAGNYVVNESRSLTLEAGQLQVYPIEFTPESEREIYFIEASIEDETGKEQVFHRTNIGLLPPHEFTSTSDENIMGLSAYWAIPDSTELKRLLNRMGVRWVRNGINSSFKNIEAMYHNNIDWTKKWSDTERDKQIRTCFQEIVKNGNKIWEFGNELNMSSPDIGGAGEGIGKALLAEPYVKWLKAIRKIQSEKTEWQKIKIISFGFAGTDEVFLEKLVTLGGWELLDGIALHPGRGNFTPDYPVTVPWNEFEKPSSGYQYWNYYGSIRILKNFIKAHGNDKDLYLTEVYALDFPNHSWNDTPRESAENVVLSFALAAAEGVKNALYYQLFNSVWNNQLGVREDNREYFFGLINRDLSFKPSLMAYCNISEALDGARFKGWIKFSENNPFSKGIMFDTPKGPMSIIWDRIEGDILPRPNGNSSPEPWISSWNIQTELTLPCKEESITVLNAIGQKESIPVKDHKATITLTGAPVIIYGMDASQMQLHGDAPTSIENLYVNGKDIRISPNPVKDRLFIKANFHSDIEQMHLYIYNVIGQQIVSQSIPVSGNTLEYSINVTGINAGIYYAVFDINGVERITKKVIKQ